MCTLIAVRGRHPRYPLLVGANRDEFYQRPSTPPVVTGEAPRILAPRDELAGGTWMGANDRGLFVALTNQRQHQAPDRTRRSRGQVVLSLLAESSVAGIEARLSQTDPSETNDFNLLFGDVDALRVAYSRAGQSEVEVAPLGAGVWVLPNDRIGSLDFPKATRAAASIEALSPDALFPDGLRDVLSDPTLPPLEEIPEPPPGSRFDRALLRRLQALCIHTPHYGTRSATLLALGAAGVERYLFADGPPCTTEFHDFASLFSS
ncbi:MAG: NRDE family protein [Sandaracinaceae bacterium]